MAKRRLRLKRWIKELFMYIFLGLIVYSSINIALYNFNTGDIKEMTEAFKQFVKIDEETKEVSIDYNSLKNINDDMKAYLIINGTNISYPVVQTSNNDFYLSHDFAKNVNKSGWIFFDYSNNIEEDKNLVIYGHAMKNKTMFGELSKLLDNTWYNNPNNLDIKLYIDDKEYTYRVFSVYKVNIENYYINTNITEDTFDSFINTVKNRSDIVLDTDTTNTRQILTLSTCYDNVRLAVHAARVNDIN